MGGTQVGWGVCGQVTGIPIKDFPWADGESVRHAKLERQVNNKILPHSLIHAGITEWLICATVHF